MLVPALQRAALTLAVAASISSVPMLPSNLDAHHMSSTATSSSSWISATSYPVMATAVDIPLPFRQYQTANDIPRALYKQKILRGRVVKVIDGDTVRIRHTPLYPLSNGERGCTGRKLSECTISVRLYGVDAPETAKRGDPRQPYAKEAKEYLSQRVNGRIVRVKLLRKDQYNRVVGRVTTRRNRYIPFLWTDLSRGLAGEGYATLYTGGGAEYDGNREVLEKKIRRAQERRRGIWSDGVDGYVDPAAYKREIKARRNNGQGR